jgi:hypothetical protein
MSEGQLLVGLSHAYHHLNFAWHVRRLPTARYKNLTDRDFNRWSKVPRDVDIARVEAGEIGIRESGTRRRRRRGVAPNARSRSA